MTLSAKLKYGAAAVALLVTAALVIAGMNHHFTDRDLDSILKSETSRFEVTSVMAAGCVAAGMTDQNLGQMMAASRGMICLQILQDTLPDAIHGRSACDAQEGPADRRKCLFSLGYVAVVMRALNRAPETDDDYDALRADIDSAYGKINATKEQQ